MVALRDDLIAALCRRPCRAAAITRSERRLMPDGTEVVSGDLPPVLCGACPERDNPEAPLRHIEVLYGFPPGGGVWGGRDIENAVRINVQYDDAP